MYQDKVKKQSTKKTNRNVFSSTLKNALKKAKDKRNENVNLVKDTSLTLVKDTSLTSPSQRVAQPGVVDGKENVNLVKDTSLTLVKDTSLTSPSQRVAQPGVVDGKEDVDLVKDTSLTLVKDTSLTGQLVKDTSLTTKAGEDSPNVQARRVVFGGEVPEVEDRESIFDRPPKTDIIGTELYNSGFVLIEILPDGMTRFTIEASEVAVSTTINIMHFDGNNRPQSGVMTTVTEERVTSTKMSLLPNAA